MQNLRSNPALRNTLRGFDSHDWTEQTLVWQTLVIVEPFLGFNTY